MCCSYLCDLADRGLIQIKQLHMPYSVAIYQQTLEHRLLKYTVLTLQRQRRKPIPLPLPPHPSPPPTEGGGEQGRLIAVLSGSSFFLDVQYLFFVRPVRIFFALILLNCVFSIWQHILCQQFSGGGGEGILTLLSKKDTTK